MSDDAELLRRYAEEGLEAAFAEWVQRHLGLVYAAALRRLAGNAHGAAEVAQGVFLRAAREARVLAERESVTGWLYTATRNAAINLMRDEHRRRQREEAASVLSENAGGAATGRGVADEGPEDWERLRPVLDAAMDELGAADREAVLLRFFEGRPFAEVGQRLQLSENTARMRVERALDKLHALLARRGVTSTAAALGLVLANQAGAATTVLPAGLAGSVTSGALAGAAGGAGVSGGGVAGGILKFMGLTKTMVAAGGALVVCALLGTAAWEYREVRGARERGEMEKRQLAAIAQRIREVDAKSAAAGREAAEWTGKLAVAQAAAKAEAARKSAAAVVTAAKPAAVWDSIAEGRKIMERYPEMKRVVVARSDAIINFGFEPMFKELGLTPEQIEAFRRLMREQNFVGAPAGPRGENVSFLAGTNMPFAEMDGHLREILGDANLERLGEFFRQRDARTTVAQWAASLALTDTPVSGEQADRLTRLMMETAMPPDGGKVGEFDWDIILARAPALLATAQVQSLAARRPKSGGGK